MLKLIFVSICVLLLTSVGHSQGNKYKKEKINENYFDLLFSSNIFLNTTRTIIKVEIKEDNKFFLSTKKAIQQFFKLKFNVSDSVADKMGYIFLSNNGKMSYSDSTMFATIHNEAIYFYSDTILNKFRKLNTVTFLNQYFSFLPHDENIFPIAYLYEKGMFYDWDSKSVSIITIETLRSSFGIIWDDKEKKWIKK